MRVRFFVNPSNAHAVASRDALVARATAAGLSVVSSGACDVIIALGGDGTILKAIREIPQTPVLGFNFGALGYLAHVEERDFDRAFALLRANRWQICERTRLAVSKNGASQHLALNDVVVVREMTGHAAVLDLTVNGCEAARYTADGLVVATPTGSTAYSLSAGGPILMPATPCFVVTPMNPHALGVRPLVLPDNVHLGISSRRRVPGIGEERVGVYADGEEAFFLSPDESVEIVRAPDTASFVELEGLNPYAIMARKLGWRGSNRA